MKRRKPAPADKRKTGLTMFRVIFCILLMMACLAKSGKAENGDTLVIEPGYINTNWLKEGSNTYLVYLRRSKEGSRSFVQLWNRKIERISYKGKPAIQITQKWESNDSIIHTSRSVSDAVSLKPFIHEFWWKAFRPGFSTGTTQVDFEQGSLKVDGHEVTAGDTSKMLRQIWNGYQASAGKFFLNWHLDLETFSTLPYKQGVTFLIPFYDPGTQSGFDRVCYTVQGSAYLTVFDAEKIDCWLLLHTANGLRETFWISKKSRELLKVEQVMNNSIFFYEIKLGIAES